LIFTAPVPVDELPIISFLPEEIPAIAWELIFKEPVLPSATPIERLSVDGLMITSPLVVEIVG
jgi:hypothetical protein